MDGADKNVGPGAEEEFEWDPSKSTVTAWSTNHTRLNKGRRAYGRRGSKKSAYGDAGAGNGARAFQRRRPFQSSNIGLDDDDASVELAGNQSNAEWGSASSGSSIDLTRPETLVAPPPPRPLGDHVRSKSITATAGAPQRPPLLRHSRSMSISSIHGTRDSFRSSLSSGSSSTDSVFEQSENTQPNIIGQEDEIFSSHRSPQPPTKLKKIDMTPSNVDNAGFSRRKKLMRQRQQETDLSDSSPSFVSPNHNSFRQLAQSAELAAAWIKLPDLSPSVKETIGVDFGYFADSNAASPTQSVATTSSSRKRGVCELPFDDGEDFSFTTAHSFSGMSSPSASTRSRSRSRIFSGGTIMAVPASESPAPSELFVRGETDDDSHDEKSDQASQADGSDDSSVEQAMDFELEEPDKMTSLVPPNQVRRSSSNNFDGSAFGASEKTEGNLLAPSHIFETMSDYEDLKYLIKALRKEKLGSTIASFGPSKVWTILPKSEWDPRRRAAFLQWASRGLGFSLRSGGGGVAYLQMPVSKGGDVLESLQTALVAHKKKSQDEKVDLPLEKDTACIVPSATFSARYVQV